MSTKMMMRNKMWPCGHGGKMSKKKQKEKKYTTAIEYAEKVAEKHNLDISVRYNDDDLVITIDVSSEFVRKIAAKIHDKLMEDAAVLMVDPKELVALAF